MPKFTFVVLSNPVAEREIEYNRWYEQQHLPDVLRVPGIVAARRMRATAEGAKWRYLAMYEIEADDVNAVLAELRSRSGGPQMPMSEALDRENLLAMAFESMS